MGLAAAAPVGDDTCAPWARAGEHAVPACQDYAMSASNNGNAAQLRPPFVVRHRSPGGPSAQTDCCPDTIRAPG
jgi:hypothetical protein